MAQNDVSQIDWIYDLDVYKRQDMDNCSERMNCLMENCFDYLDQNIDTVQKILRNNPCLLYTSIKIFQIYFRAGN